MKRLTLLNGPAESLPFAVWAAAEFQGAFLVLTYELRGALNAIRWPAAGASPRRRSGLWETTCFEVFLQPEGAAAYHEFNLSPGGDWELFHFERYRVGMRAVARALPPKLETTEIPGGRRWRAHLESDVFRWPGGGVRIGLTAVTESENGAETEAGALQYWALSNHGANGGPPDFHRAGAWNLRLDYLA